MTSLTERTAAALERIATALERQADADPLTALSRIMEDGGEVPQVGTQEPQEPVAYNGHTAVYMLPDPDWQIVARRDASAEGGFAVKVERA